MTETHIYKETPGCKIRLDVHRCEPTHQPAPAILWIHGGALIEGSREGCGHASRYVNRGYTVFSIDYRLAPESKLPEIVADVQDALSWIREQGAEVANIDPERVGVVGHSAGGYLTLMTGTFSRPPKALVSYYGYGDVVGPWYAEPDPFYCSQQMVEEGDARRHYSGPPVTRPDERPGSGGFYLYCRQQGVWPNEVGGRDPKTDSEFFVPYCPEQNVTEESPPTMLLHGTNDTDVPYELSVRMAEALEQTGVERHLITIPEGGHGFDGHQGSADPEVITKAQKGMLDFLDAHV